MAGLTTTTTDEGPSPTNSVNRLLPTLGRLLIAILFLMGGFGKLAAASATIAMIDSAGLPFPPLAYAVALLVEIGGGTLLVLGYRTRLTAAIIAVFTIVTAAVFHHNFADQNDLIHFFKNLAISGGALQIVAFGAGAWSLDARRRSAAVRPVAVQPI